MYQIKVYTNWLVFKKVINERQIVWSYNFTANINSSMWPLNILLNTNINNNEYNVWDIVKVFWVDDFNKTWKQVYWWVINKIRRIGDETKETIELQCLWYSQLFFYSTITWISTNDLPENIVTNIFNYVSWLYPWLFSIWWLWSWTTISYSINDWSNAIDHFQKIWEETWWKWFIDSEWVLTFWEKPNTATHSLTYQSNISNLEVIEDWDEIINSVIVEYSPNFSSRPWPLQVLQTTVDNSSSISQYWLRQVILRWDTRLISSDPTEFAFFWPIWLTSAIDLWNNTLNLEPKRVLRIKVNNRYDYQSIKPWDTIKVKNIWLIIDNVQVLKVQYWIDGATIDCEKLQNLGTIWQSLRSFLK